MTTQRNAQYLTSCGRHSIHSWRNYFFWCQASKCVLFPHANFAEEQVRYANMHSDAQRLKCDAGGGAVQQAPEASIGTLQGSMQRGASLNVPPPVARTAGGLKGNWGLFWGAVQRDHCHAGLIWNEGTRAELREALQVQLNPDTP